MDAAFGSPDFGPHAGPVSMTKPEMPTSSARKAGYGLGRSKAMSSFDNTKRIIRTLRYGLPNPNEP
jgi:hypothetical protein